MMSMRPSEYRMRTRRRAAELQSISTNQGETNPEPSATLNTEQPAPEIENESPLDRKPTYSEVLTQTAHVSPQWRVTPGKSGRPLMHTGNTTSPEEIGGKSPHTPNQSEPTWPQWVAENPHNQRRTEERYSSGPQG